MCFERRWNLCWCGRTGLKSFMGTIILPSQLIPRDIMNQICCLYLSSVSMNCSSMHQISRDLVSCWFLQPCGLAPALRHDHPRRNFRQTPDPVAWPVEFEFWSILMQFLFLKKLKAMCSKETPNLTLEWTAAVRSTMSQGWTEALLCFISCASSCPALLCL